MAWSAFDDWIAASPLPIVGTALFLAMCMAAALGTVLQVWSDHDHKAAPNETSDEQEGYVVTAVLGLLALLLGFTFSLAADRFEARRHLVLEEANAIGTVYLRAQLLPEPHRSRISNLLIRYTDNRIVLGHAKPGLAQQRLLATSDTLLTDLWSATAAGFDAIKDLPFSAVFVESVNNLIDLDGARKAARQAHVPVEVFGVLFAYQVTAAGVLGYVLRGARGRMTAGLLLALLTLSFLLIVDIDRPTLGGIVEDQGPMLELRKSLAAQPPRVFDKWRTTPQPAGPSR